MNIYLKKRALLLLIFFLSCTSENKQNDMISYDSLITNDANVLFLHHSTGNIIVKGGASRFLYRITKKGNVHKWFDTFNSLNKTRYKFENQVFPKKEIYGWSNYPYDYYNIWVKHGGPAPYKGEPTLEILTKKYNLIILKHCYPVSKIIDDLPPDINSPVRTLENYKLQYNALKTKMQMFKDTKFIFWTAAALSKVSTDENQASKAKEFVDWVVNYWDEKGDNIFLWDFYNLETEGELYIKPENSFSPENSHPSSDFARKVYPYFCKRIVDVLNGNGDTNSITGI